MQPVPIQYAEENRVIVRVWTSAFNPEIPGEGVGHISIELPEIAGSLNISLWPQGEPSKNPLKAMFEKRPAEYNQTYDDDKRDEGGKEPTFVVCLYTLDAQRMSQEFQALKVRNKEWTLFGRNLLMMSTAHSCASLAYEILKKGGIYSLVSSVASFTYSSVVAPDTLVPMLKKAKQKELKLHPYTKHYQDPKIQESTIAEESSSYCRIM